MTNQLLTIAKAAGIGTNDLLKNEANWLIFHLNGIKTELKFSRKGYGFVAAYDNEDIADLIKDEFPGATDTKGARYWFDTAAQLEEIVTLTKTLIEEAELTQQRGSQTRRTDDDTFFLTTAKAIKSLVELEAWDFLSGRLSAFDDHDNLIRKGESKAVQNDRNAPTWREHVVPCTLIKEEAIRMAQAGDSVEDIANMLEANLAIVIITPAEARILDAVYQTTMPTGWNFGDDIYARLTAFGIEFS